MPVTPPPPQIADELSTKSQRTKSGVSGSTAQSGGTKKHAAARTSSTATANRDAGPSTSATGGSLSSIPTDSASLTYQPGKPSSQDVLPQMSSAGTATKRAIETSIWDWDHPLDSVGASSPYIYEPQGELVNEQRDQRPPRTEFSIPHAISSVSSHWPFPPSAVIPSDNGGFAVPSRPTGVTSSVAGSKRKSSSDRSTTAASKANEPKRPSRVMSESGEDLASPARSTRSQSGPAPRRAAAGAAAEGSSRDAADALRIQGSTSGPSGILRDPALTSALNARKAFPIQIGDKLFRLSGASISSDAPSYFSEFFEQELRQNPDTQEEVRTLYIDRDSATFEDIVLHLQGYHVQPRDGPHFVKLFADAQFFSLPRLTEQLYSSTIYIRIGDEEFQIPRDLFSNPGDSPNYFSLGFSAFFTSPSEASLGFSQRPFLRPPSILPPSVPNRSSKTFADLIHFLKGYPVEIRGEQHRQELLRDARYYHLKGLEQRLIPHYISYNLARKTAEILIRLEDLRQSGISFIADTAVQSEAVSPGNSTSGTPSGPGWVFYQRPYVDDEPRSLIVEVDGEETTSLSIAPATSSSIARLARATFNRKTLARITSLFSVIANKMNLPITQPLGLMMMERRAGGATSPSHPGNTGISEERVKVRIGADADVTLNGVKWLVGEQAEDEADDDDMSMDIDPSDTSRSGQKRKRSERDEQGAEWIVTKAQWRLRIQPVTAASRTGIGVILGTVKMEAFSDERARNAAQGFLV